MYRKTGSDGYYTSAEHKYKSASLRMSERKQDHGFSSDHGSENKQQDRGRDHFSGRDRERYPERDQDRGRDNVYIRSRTFQNVSCLFLLVYCVDVD